MSLIEEYYELNEAEDVTGMWKVMILTFYVLAGCVGLWCGYTIAVLRKKFEGKCYLFTEIKLINFGGEKLDTTNIIWGNDALCDFSQYSMVSSFIVATIWATFFLMCGKGGKSLTGLPQPWRIVVPSLVFNFIYFFLTLGAAINIQDGTDHFCGKRTLNSIQSNNMFDFCLIIEQLIKTDLQVTKFQLDVVTKTSWGCTASWFVLFLLAFFRIIFVADFQMYKICVFKIGDAVKNEREEILRITTYEEPKKPRFQDEKNKRVSFYGKEEDDFLDVLNKKKNVNMDKKSLNQTFNTRNFSIPPKTFFYMATDIRNLSREKKRKNVSKNLNEVFNEERGKLQIDLRSTPSLEEPKLLHRYKMDLVKFGDSGKPDFCGGELKNIENENFNQDLDAFGYSQETFILGSKKYV